MCVIGYNKVYMYPYLSVNFQDYGRYMFRQKLNYIRTILFVGSVKTLELSSEIFQLENTNRDIEYYPWITTVIEILSHEIIMHIT